MTAHVAVTSQQTGIIGHTGVDREAGLQLNSSLATFVVTYVTVVASEDMIALFRFVSVFGLQITISVR